MRRWHVVLGANYGDEGKGLVTDWLCDQLGTDLCVRFNGGAQAGHTVVTPYGSRHVFGHLGAGAFAGADTLLGPRFVVNPLLYFKERARLFQSEMPVNATTWVSRYAPVTTPYEMAIQQESVKTKTTCGVGINETMQRHKVIPLEFGDLGLRHRVADKLELIQEYVITRSAELGINPMKVFEKASALCVGDWMDQCENMAAVCNQVQAVQDLLDGDIVFEGAQGLGLDSEHKDFPYVTHSRTGLDNVLALHTPEEMDVYFVTRSYVTRHGDGPLPNEWPKCALAHRDTTNVENQWQGAFRIGFLTIEDLATAIQFELRKVPSSVKVNPHVVVTHLDQARANIISYFAKEEPWTFWPGIAADVLRQSIPGVKLWGSYGPTRTDVREL